MIYLLNPKIMKKELPCTTKYSKNRNKHFAYIKLYNLMLKHFKK
jgi:hypothetical protein